MKNRIQLLPNVITAFGLTCGLFAIFKTLLLDDGNLTHYELIRFTTVLLIVAAVADVLDGAVARLTNGESSFGMIFDSISDAITFGVAPSILAISSQPWEEYPELPFLVTTAAIIYSVCGALRLVRYSVVKYEKEWAQAEPVEVITGQSKNFTGLPIPAAACAVISTALFLQSPEFKVWGWVGERMGMNFLMMTMVLAGYLMVSRWRFPSLGALQVRVRSFGAIFLTALFAVLLLYGVHRHFPIVFFLVSWGYIAVACVLSTMRLIGGKRLATLEDFEPLPDELDE